MIRNIASIAACILSRSARTRGAVVAPPRRTTLGLQELEGREVPTVVLWDIIQNTDGNPDGSIRAYVSRDELTPTRPGDRDGVVLDTWLGARRSGVGFDLEGYIVANAAVLPNAANNVGADVGLAGGVPIFENNGVYVFAGPVLGNETVGTAVIAGNIRDGADGNETAYKVRVTVVNGPIFGGLEPSFARGSVLMVNQRDIAGVNYFTGVTGLPAGSKVFVDNPHVNGNGVTVGGKNINILLGGQEGTFTLVFETGAGPKPVTIVIGTPPPANRPPVATNPPFGFTAGTGFVGVAASFATDLDGDTLVFTAATGSGGLIPTIVDDKLDVRATGFGPRTGWVIYTVSDGRGGTVNGTSTVSVTGAAPITLGTVQVTAGALVTLDSGALFGAGRTVVSLENPGFGVSLPGGGSQMIFTAPGVPTTFSFRLTLDNGQAVILPIQVNAAPVVPPTVPPVSPPVSPPVVPPVSPPVVPPVLRSSDLIVVSANGQISVQRSNGTIVSSFPNGLPQGIEARVAQLRCADGELLIAVASGPGVRNQVLIFDVVGRRVQTLYPFEETFTLGAFVAAGDVTGDGCDDLIVTPDQGGGPRVSVYSGLTLTAGREPVRFADYFGIEDVNFRGGARAAAGDVNGDGKADIIVSAGFTGGPRVAVWDGAGLTVGRVVRVGPDFFAFVPELRNGAYVAAGDVDGDGFADIIAGGGPGGAPHVTVFDGRLFAQFGTPVVIASFYAGDSNNNTNGVRVAAQQDRDADYADVVTASGRDNDQTMNLWDVRGNGVNPTLLTTRGFNDPIGIFVG